MRRLEFYELKIKRVNARNPFNHINFISLSSMNASILSHNSYVNQSERRQEEKKSISVITQLMPEA